MKKHMKNIGFYALLFIVFMIVLSVLTMGPVADVIDYSDFVNRICFDEVGVSRPFYL